VVGRVDYARAEVVENAIEPLSLGGAALLLSSATQTDGL
jgi:hypothetical protein